MDQFLDLPYVASSTRSRLHEFDLFVPQRRASAQPLPPLICFVHGGAWRSEDKGNHAALARRLAAHTGYPVAVPNYRLTTPEHHLRHPAHAEDLLQFLTYVLAWRGPAGASQPLYDPTRLYLVGHSCSAHMTASVLLDAGIASLAPSEDLLHAVRGVIFSEGIYDIDALLESFPGYRDWFIANTFGDLPSYAAFSVIGAPRRAAGAHIRWLIVHSKGDTLVDLRQSSAMYDYLQSLEAGENSAATTVTKNWEELEDGHNEILQTEAYTRIAGDFVLSVSAE
ncbi:alpha/beta-hydrolase [Artomyces pyxidatus]|uniref:Alpha/beta-hydrolase n=1 Tax=Artomyces pyxidatus TaxID=48021 RepID=A0ACB8TBC8_9AGAM|nr:alpha/beta-hydrolase [Artomyces pyxidatus]